MSFKAFPQKSLVFLENIAKNNSKEWFLAHKDEYEKYILEPSRAFVEEMSEHLMALEPTINYAPKINHSLFKIYRDICRMGENKKPMKERIGYIFWQGGAKRLQSSSFYLHFSSTELFVSVGVRWFEKPMLDAYREFIKDEKNAKELFDIIKKLEEKGFKIIEKGYKYYPKGFTKETPYSELSLYKGMASYITLDATVVCEDDFIEKLYEIYEAMLPMQQLMYRVSLLS